VGVEEKARMLCLAAVTAVVERLEANMPNAVFDMVRVGRGMIVFWETIAPSMHVSFTGSVGQSGPASVLRWFLDFDF